MPGFAPALLIALLAGVSFSERLPELTGSLEDRVESLARELDGDRPTLAFGLERRASDLDGARAEVDVTPELAEESLALLVPLADRLGMGRQRSRLEDASFRLLDPERYERAQAAVFTPPGEDDALLERISAQTVGALARRSVQARASARVKSLYSLQRKAARYGVEPEALLDRLGVRVIVPSEADCYAALQVIRAAHPEVPGSFDDYILLPKPSGYQSLHTAVLARTASGLVLPVELQIRTEAMHAAAESGAAAHWRYKLT